MSYRLWSTGRGFGVLAEKRKNVWHPDGDHTAMISSRNLVVFVRHVQLLPLVGPSPRIGDRNRGIGITLNDDHRHVFDRCQRVWVEAKWGRSDCRNRGPIRWIFHTYIKCSGATHGMSHQIRPALIELEHHGFLQRTRFTGTTVTTLTVEDAQQIFEVRVALEPLAFHLVAIRASDRDIAGLNELIGKTRLKANAEDLEGFFEAHLSFRNRVWEISRNRSVQNLQRVVIPLYALYLISRSYNHEGILPTIVECLEHQDKILDAFQRRDAETARQVAGDFLVRMKEYLGTRLVPDIPAPIS